MDVRSIKDSAPIDYNQVVEYWVPFVFTAFMVEALLYGIHAVLFCICIRVLGTRRNPAHLVVFVSIVIMFAISTADIALSFRFIFKDLPAVLKFQVTLKTTVDRILPKGYLYATNNLFADGLLVYRCYKIWGNRLLILLVGFVVLLAQSVWGYLIMNTSILSDSFAPVFYWSVFAFNIFMTLVTAGRIWWVARIAGTVLGKRQIRRYHTAIAILVESGAIYSIAVLLLVIIPSTRPCRIVFLIITVRIVCIMPTLMIVQVEATRKHETVQQERRAVSLGDDQLSTVPPLSEITTGPVISADPTSVQRDLDLVVDIEKQGDLQRTQHLLHT